MRTALAIVNERGAGLGALEPILRDQGFRVDAVAGTDLGSIDILDPDLVVTLGSSAGVSETYRHPFISPEIALLQDRLYHRRPTLGVCFGAQLIATALGETVRPQAMREVGFRSASLTEEGERSPLRHLAGVAVMEWHGDTFDLPRGAVLLASSGTSEVEAFAVGGWLLGVQFHPELTSTMAAQWLEGDAEYAGAAGYDSAVLRQDVAAGRFERMHAATRLALSEWLDALE
ncbi:glutamine amidotransferase-related protein [Rathayibacter tanaceti]|uniref:Glutamine amidotransferase n=2 Tax=Rathayibacter tanaceti TaxID=1671680 RepID=A0A162GF28_9MICO|nr:gamma-glutamyl-gamma-aminobutyrate hydrolase family protein [Rathayibacter tanaceti]KZX20129.1 glutamine amidotransferase [Rathayibacter tanaceti]QHC54675.1 glutamine amidotransferase [Rathayibacter tanaceti]TCO37515.1 GMP synthase (glutamine-hydrolysing) [Rathayibacter tanaceti]